MKKWMTVFILMTTLLMKVGSNHDVFAIEGISSHCGVLMEQLTGRVMFEKCADEKMYIASITKILTAIIAIENGDLDEWVEILDEDVHQVGSALYLIEGDQMTLGDLIYGLMLRSGNDAAWAIARHIGGGDVDTFVALMNEKAKEIGMENSTFQNPSGLDETTYNLSTAKDMALAQRYAMNNPIFRDISYESLHRATSEQGKIFTWKNKHRLVNGRYEHAISGKTGFTEQAKRTLVTSANNGDLELVAVTLVGGNDWNDHIAMFEYGFNNFNMRQVTDIGELQLLEQELLQHAGFDRLFVREEKTVFLRNDEQVRKHLVLSTDETAHAVGTLEILVNDQLIETLPVYAFEDFPTGSWWQRLLDLIIGI
ncbi:MAG: D-alanyl-D-alanine carboxypeptidase [Defluviitaleaceae bacterium]|nr:D-alanyl-D-alanine carboxypeptidase [Defluviitaleaceae bacterium]